MKHKISLLLIIQLFFFNNVRSQKNINNIVDKKIYISQKTIDNILNNKELIYAKQTNSIKGNSTQLTNDNIADIELHSAINPVDTSNIIISWMNLDAGNSSMPLIFKLFYTIDFGETWNEANIDFIPRNIQANEALSGGGDPFIVFDNLGNIYISWIYTIVRVISADEIYVDVYLTYAKSTDKGATWIRPENGDDFISSGVLNYELTGGITGINTGNFPDKQWMAINPITNDLYCSLAEFNTTDNYNTGIETWGIRKKTSGATLFEDKVLVPPAGTVWAQLGALAIDKTGNTHAVYPYYPAFPEPPLEKLMHSVSVDNGITYSTPHFISDIDVTRFQGVGQDNPTSTGMYDRLYPSSYIAIDTSSTSPYENRIYVCWNSNDANYIKKVDVLLSYSDDNGTTWSTPEIVNTDLPRDYGFHHRPTIYVNPDGILVMGWHDNRGYEIPDVYMNDYYYALSYDGGNTFEEYKVSHDAFNYNDGNFESSVGIGEYFQIIATKNNVIAFYPYFDGEDTEIYFNILPFGEATEINELSPVTDKISIKNIFPNPVRNELNFLIQAKNTSNITYSIYSVEGRLINRFTDIKIYTGKNRIHVNINNIPAGTYFLLIDTEYGKFIKKFIKSK
ncbi:MAG: T9SS type A sorting domain-containing protein [Bacteroidales bacterium]|nr:T9SS type A sorting domain-containing protein [Bacteroidales bacterium]